MAHLRTTSKGKKKYQVWSGSKGYRKSRLIASYTSKANAVCRISTINKRKKRRR